MNTPTNAPLGDGGNAGGIIYNLTIKVDAAVAADWLQWMLQEHIPAIMNTECFTDFKVVKLMDMDESDGLTYAVQYHTPNMAGYEKFKAECAADMYGQLVQKWKQQIVWFETAMQVIH